MDKVFLIQLTKNLYQLTLLFPKKEPLRYKMRELADEILANCLISPLKQNLSLEDFEILDSFFEVAKSQKWVRDSDILAIQEQYAKLGREIQEIKLEIRERKREKAKISNNSLKEELKPKLLQRQQKILEALKGKGKMQVWEAKEIFPEVTKRTLRRDFEKLLTQGLVKRIGERNATFYQLTDEKNVV